MEACGTAHYLERRCRARELCVRLLPGQYVRPYVRRTKTDRTDTEALLEANRCGGVDAVPVKTVEQQALQVLHRVRTQWQGARTARINAMRSILREHGFPISLGARTALKRASLPSSKTQRLRCPNSSATRCGWSSKRCEILRRVSRPSISSWPV